MNRLEFLDRDEERKRLKAAFASGGGSFCCLYGRRRLGKSSLLQATLPPERSVYYVGDQRDAALQRESVAKALAALVPGFEQVRYPDWASLFERWWKDAPRTSVLALDEFPYMVMASPELPSILQKLIDQHTNEIHVVICGSSQRMMQGLVLDSSAPLYGRAQEIIRVAPLNVHWLDKALQCSSALETLNAYAVWGGVPWYWELAMAHASLWEAVGSTVLDPMGALHNEPRRLLLDDMRDATQAISLLALVGQGCHRLSEIAARLGKPATSLTRPMHRLLELGLVQRETPFGASPNKGKKTLYRIEDPFLAFWFRYVDPNRSRLEAGLVNPVLRDIKKTFSHHAAGVWETLARRAVPHLNLADTEWEPAARWWGAGLNQRPMEVDIVAESVDRRRLLVGEAKLHLSATERSRVEETLAQKAEQLPFADRYDHVETVVFAADGCTDLEGVISAQAIIEAMK